MQNVQSEHDKLAQPQRKAYKAPKLVRHGSVEQLTQTAIDTGPSCPIDIKIPR